MTQYQSPHFAATFLAIKSFPALRQALRKLDPLKAGLDFSK